MIYTTTKVGYLDNEHSYSCWHRCSGELVSYGDNSYSNSLISRSLRVRNNHGGAISGGSTSRSTSVRHSKEWFRSYGSRWFSSVSNTVSVHSSHGSGSGGCTAQHHGYSSRGDSTFSDHQSGNSRGSQCSQQHIYLSMHQHDQQSRWDQAVKRSRGNSYSTTQINQDYLTDLRKDDTLISYCYTSSRSLIGSSISCVSSFISSY